MGLIMINIQNKNDCCGCWACYNVCSFGSITMTKDSEGFYYPVVNTDLCKDCSRCNNVCPITNHTPLKNEPTAYACYSSDSQIVKESSSGGIFYTMAENVLANNGVIFGARFDDSFNVIHSYTESLQSISPFMQSKYVQSSVNDAYKQAKEFLNNCRTVLFAGTPCQIAGLHNYLNKDYSNLITFSIFCHGVPSPLAFEKYLKVVDNTNSISSVSFRNKDNGWHNYNVAIASASKNIKENVFENIYMQGFLADLFLRPSCHSCKFKSCYNIGDLVVGDFWGVEKLYPEIDKNTGISVVLVNTKKGQEYFNNIKQNIFSKDISFKDATKFNPAYFSSPIPHQKRKYFFKNINTKPFDRVVQSCLKNSIINRSLRIIHKKTYALLHK